MDYLIEAKNIENYVIESRRYLHQIPELGNDLPNTSKFVREELKKMGVEVLENVGVEHAVVGIIKGKENGKVIALRADMDALPIKEETGLDFESKNGCMHACGHDAHTSILLGVAKLLSSNKDKIKGTVKLIFQTGEELSIGAKPLVEAGVLDNPKVDRIYGLHVGSIGKGMSQGQFSVCKGPMMASLDSFKFTVKGKQAHGAYPQDSVDPTVITSHIILAFQEIISREIAPTEPGLITIGKIEAGKTYNIIPKEVHVEGTARGVTHETREYIAKRMKEMSESIAKSFRGEADFEYGWAAPPLVNDLDSIEFFEKTLNKVLDESAVFEMTTPVMGGEDFAEYLEKVPGAFIFFYNPMEIDGEIHPHHNPKFALDEAEFYKAVGVMTAVAVEYLNE
ncbi:M20 family metallopeptidase [Lagierella sp.]|uniref:M20 metallopeptidase family protein n=1 Tax=Lagierella sp. TaxID=2849657 RepID=UPI00261F520E|nr:M20 family metallopeptidase [Lagierella sp.]